MNKLIFSKYLEENNELNKVEVKRQNTNNKTESSIFQARKSSIDNSVKKVSATSYKNKEMSVLELGTTMRLTNPEGISDNISTSSGNSQFMNDESHSISEIVNGRSRQQREINLEKSVFNIELPITDRTTNDITTPPVSPIIPLEPTDLVINKI